MGRMDSKHMQTRPWKRCTRWCCLPCSGARHPGAKCLKPAPPYTTTHLQERRSPSRRGRGSGSCAGRCRCPGGSARSRGDSGRGSTCAERKRWRRCLSSGGSGQAKGEEGASRGGAAGRPSSAGAGVRLCGGSLGGLACRRLVGLQYVGAVDESSRNGVEWADRTSQPSAAGRLWGNEGDLLLPELLQMLLHPHKHTHLQERRSPSRRGRGSGGRGSGGSSGGANRCRRLGRYSGSAAGDCLKGEGQRRSAGHGGPWRLGGSCSARGGRLRAKGERRASRSSRRRLGQAKGKPSAAGRGGGRWRWRWRQCRDAKVKRGGSRSERRRRGLLSLRRLCGSLACLGGCSSSKRRSSREVRKQHGRVQR